MRFRRPISLLFLGLLLLPPLPLSAALYQVDPAGSKIEVLVIPGGLFGVFGHDHEILSRKLSGTISYDAPSHRLLGAEIRLPAASLTVVDPEAIPRDRKEVQAIMRGPRVLDAARYPEIRFSSTGAAPAPVPSRILVSGDLTLHGASRRISFPVRLAPSPGELEATGTVKVRQSDFGIVPIRFAGGAMRLKDQVEIHFTVLAREKPPVEP
ncbi:conserved exported protein of unknown function [Methylacidimicrobium sp. AP8]|uniref:YceI family protein n=1 Tax=Methylacidimicrobium sp. AP8 TaxID=2730359 RepID=UPI0018C04D10|nr:YceI family protein [Methylacidimicrobium sp. AP8]CAB4242810.1 conserved exported protein of unknown function [Methylacidimicrobium sp. AP8]